LSHPGYAVGFGVNHWFATETFLPNSFQEAETFAGGSASANSFQEAKTFGGLRLPNSFQEDVC
jgi:hypothetical protein